MKTEELLIVIKLLRMASDEFSNHSCNDLGDSFFKDIPHEIIDDIDSEMFKECGDEDSFIRGERILVCNDSALMDHFADKLQSEYGLRKACDRFDLSSCATGRVQTFEQAIAPYKDMPLVKQTLDDLRDN